MAIYTPLKGKIRPPTLIKHTKKEKLTLRKESEKKRNEKNLRPNIKNKKVYRKIIQLGQNKESKEKPRKTEKNLTPMNIQSSTNPTTITNLAKPCHTNRLI